MVEPTNAADLDPRFRVEQTPQGERMYTDRGEAVLEVLAPGVVRVRYQGVVGVAFAHHVQPRLEAWIREGHRIFMAIDARELGAYDSEYRRAWTTWLDTHRADVDGVHILSRSRLVQMGISLVNAVTGGVVTAHVNHSEFESALGMASDARHPADRPN